jgi:hypothetical protein
VPNVSLLPIPNKQSEGRTFFTKEQDWVTAEVLLRYLKLGSLNLLHPETMTLNSYCLDRGLNFLGNKYIVPFPDFILQLFNAKMSLNAAQLCRWKRVVNNYKINFKKSRHD